MYNITGELRLRKAEDFYYLNQSGCIHIDGVDDTEEFGNLQVL